MIKKILKDYFPPVLIRFLAGLFYGWHGDFSSWNEAREKCSGYESDLIIEKAKISASKVKNGLAVYERDSVIFNKIEYSFPLLSGLMWIASQNSGNLNVLDFGGSLGSSYFQNKNFLDSLEKVNWCVVEQSGFVKVGTEFFENEKLHFFYSVEECTHSFEIDVVLLSSVLQYLEKPFKLIDQIISTGIEYLIIDRTPFVKGPDRLTIQKVNPKIYIASYPCWFFNKEKFMTFINNHYTLVSEFDALDKANISSEFKGFIFKRRK